MMNDKPYVLGFTRYEGLGPDGEDVIMQEVYVPLQVIDAQPADAPPVRFRTRYGMSDELLKVVDKPAESK